MPRFTVFWLPSLVLGAILVIAQTSLAADPIIRVERQVNASHKPDIQLAQPRGQTPQRAESEGHEFGTLAELRANARRSTEAVATLAAALESRDEQVRVRAAMSLGGKGAQAGEAAAALEKLLRDAKPACRLEAAIALGRIGPDAKTAAPSLEALREDEDPAIRAAAAEALTSVRWTLGAACRLEDVPATAIRGDKAICLNIAPREDDPGHPAEGWCAEVAIQEALLSFGAYFPQKTINAAGHPEHPDLYADEIPTALQNLHVRYEAWPWSASHQELQQFLAWTRRWLAAGRPVLVGVKIYPTEHDDWSLDHFSLAVGTADKALRLNTAWGYRVTCTERQLTSLQEGFSFANAQRRYYGICIQGMDLHPGLSQVGLYVLSETKDVMNVAVKCENLDRGQQYTLFKSSGGIETRGAPWVSFQARDTDLAIYDRIVKGRPCIYWCQRNDTGAKQ